MKLVYVEWLDSNAPFRRATWIDKAETETGSHKVYSVGWLVRETPDSLVLAAHIDALDKDWSQVSGAIDIPKKAVVEIRPITKGRKKCSAPPQSSVLSTPSSVASPATSTIKPS